MSLSLTTILLVPGKPKQDQDCVVQMSSHLFEHFQLKKDQGLTVLFGKKLIYMDVQLVEILPNEIVFPVNIFNEFYLPIQTYKFQAYYQPENHILQLGPIIGLLTDFYSNEEGEPHFRSVHMFCEELHQGISGEGGFFYVFSDKEFPNHGYYFENGTWIFADLPLPDVIYNRIHSRILEYSTHFKKFRKKLEQLKIPIFNDRFLSKWEVYEHLMKKKYLHTFIPETRIFSNESFIDFAEKYETVFIKPIHGSQGRNIFKLVKKDDSHYTYQSSFLSKSENSTTTYSLEEVYQQIKPVINNHFYILQQGIPLVSTNGSAIDFRVLCHKNIKNDWEVTSTVARISAEQEFVSNIARGGRIMRAVNALALFMSKTKALEVLAHMKELSIETASIISELSPGITGELGIDIGVEPDGKLWLIEVNSKPSKSFEDGQGKIRPSAKAIIKYCTMHAFNAAIEKEEK
jgi:glutathione synthase/RimK-type ligase-like ATP-grasp enzyme